MSERPPARYGIDDELIEAARALPKVDRSDIPAARSAYAESLHRAIDDPMSDDGVTIENHSIDGHGGTAITARLYRPATTLLGGAIYHAHGGGLILGDLEMTHARNVSLARELGCLVMSIDYRLAPEWPFPVPVEDVYCGLVWLSRHAEDLNVDPNAIAVHGVSAGAGLVAAAALMSRDRGGPNIRFQYLAVPMLDDRLITDSSNRFEKTPAFTRGDAQICWNAYLGPAAAGAGVSPYASAARASSLAGLPPAYIAVAEFDPLRDEGIEYARSLLRAEVPTELHLFPGTYHGSPSVREAAISRRQRDEEVAVLRKALRS